MWSTSSTYRQFLSQDPATWNRQPIWDDSELIDYFWVYWMLWEVQLVQLLCRIDTLRHFARRYAQYAENAYTQGRKERLSKIREFTPKFKVLGMWLGEEPNFSDHGLGECADTIKLCHWNNTSYRNACALYKEVVDKQLEIAVSKHAILENLKVWSQEYPASVQMTSLPTLQGEQQSILLQYWAALFCPDVNTAKTSAKV